MSLAHDISKFSLAIVGLHVDYNIHVLHVIISRHHLEIQILHITMERLHIDLSIWCIVPIPMIIAYRSIDAPQKSW
jgi:hypothetical protein